MLKAKKEELQERGYKGFTLMEMLIVVAIIAVLIAIAIPTFTAQLENSREATDKANLRSAYALLMATWLEDAEASSVTVSAEQTQANWQSESNSTTITLADGIEGAGVSGVPAKTDSYTVAITTSGEVSIS